MKLLKIIFLLFIISCAKNDNLVENNDFYIDKSLSYEVLREKIINYGKNSNFPNINN
tara:strand:- start:983 stop:1153 length:171 start_codon:yes stop_codon:yes gene_type:complete